MGLQYIIADNYKNLIQKAVCSLVFTQTENAHVWLDC